jgi:hypothetical protein
MSIVNRLSSLISSGSRTTGRAAGRGGRATGRGGRNATRGGRGTGRGAPRGAASTGTSLVRSLLRRR